MDIIERLNSVLRKRNQQEKTAKELGYNERDRLVIEIHKYFEQITEDFDFHFYTDEIDLFKDNETRFIIMIQRNNGWYESKIAFRKRFDKKNKERLSPIEIKRNYILSGDRPTLWCPMKLDDWPLNEVQQFYGKKEKIMDRLTKKLLG